MCEELREFIDGIEKMYHDSLLASIVMEVAGSKVLTSKEVDDMIKKEEDILK